MATWTPDPTFYPSPRMAMQAPAERLGYVAILNVARVEPDVLGVVDLDPRSSTYAKLIGRVDMPKADDQLHHFGWNACSSALCPYAPHPHVERRYLIVPGIRSSRIHVLDTKPDPRAPRIVKVIEPEEVFRRAGYSRLHTVHCGPEGIYVSAFGDPNGDGPGGLLLLDHDSFDVLGRWEVDRGSQFFAYDFAWHLGYDTQVTSEWGTPKMFENGLIPEQLLGAKYGRRLHVWDLRRRKHLQEIDLGPEYQLVFELRQARDPTKAYGFAGVVISLKDLSSSIWLWHRANGSWAARKVIDVPAGRTGPSPAAPEGLQGGAAALDRHQLVARRQVPLCVLLGHRRDAPVQRVGSEQAEAHRLGAHRRHREAFAASGLWSGQRRTADGRGEPRWPAGLFHELALRGHRPAILPRGYFGLDGQGRRRSEWRP